MYKATIEINADTYDNLINALMELKNEMEEDENIDQYATSISISSNIRHEDYVYSAEIEKVSAKNA